MKIFNPMEKGLAETAGFQQGLRIGFRQEAELTDLQAAKALVRDYHKAIDAAGPDDCADAIGRFTGDTYRWRGCYPFNEIDGAEQIAEKFWQPFKAAFSPVQRRENIFFAGFNRLDDGKTTWVCSMGHLLGQFHAPWLTLQPTHKMAFLRYCEFHRIEDDVIAETSLHVDVLGMMIQAGSKVAPEPTGVFMITPGPQTQDGLLFGPHAPEEGEKSLDLLYRMLNRLIASGVKTTIEDLCLDWTDDMLWWGPAGIGASYTHQGYLKGHARPFEDGLIFVRHNGHVTRIGEGNYCGFFGYPSLTMKPANGYLGLTIESDREADMRIVDLYRREGDKLAENWIFIDHLWFLKQLGLDLLERHRAMSAPASAIV